MVQNTLKRKGAKQSLHMNINMNINKQDLYQRLLMNFI